MKLSALHYCRRRKNVTHQSKSRSDRLSKCPLLQKVLFLRLGIVISFCMMGVVLGASSYILLLQNQVRTFQLQYDSVTSKMKTGIFSTINSTVTAGFLVNDIFAYAIDNGYVGKPPYITLPGFESIMKRINELAQLRAIRFAPLVNATTRVKWEAYAVANAHLLHGHNLSVSFGIYSPGHVHDTGYVFRSPYPTLLFPVWQTAPIATTQHGIMSDPHSIPDSRSQTIDRLIGTKQYQMTDILPLDSDLALRPSSVFYTPITTVDSSSTLVGISIIAFSWDDVISRSLPLFSGGIDFVLSTATQTYTISFEKGAVSGIFRGDLHDVRYNNYRVDINDDPSSLLSRISQFDYTITIYPSESFYLKYVNRFPLLICLGTIGIVVFTFFLVSIYDHLVRMREGLLIDERTKAEAASAARHAVLRSKKVYVRYMSHEMRTPLNCAYMGLKLLDMDLTCHIDKPGNEERLDTLKDITKSCDVALNILNNLLNYDKLEDGSMILARTKVCVLAYLIDSVSSMVLPAKEKNVNILFDFDSNFSSDPYRSSWSKGGLVMNERSMSMNKNRANEVSVKSEMDDESYVTEEDFISIDIFKMNKVISHLISNAIKFTPRGKNITVRVRKISQIPDIDDSMEDTVATRSSEKNFFSFRKSRSVTPYLCEKETDIENGPSGTGVISNINTDENNLTKEIIIEIIDEGTGMTYEACEKFFGDEVDFDPTDLRAPDSTGLGAMINKSILNLHGGGRISVHSDGIGFGCIFTLRLSLTPTTQRSAPSSPLKHQGSCSLDSHVKLRIVPSSTSTILKSLNGTLQSATLEEAVVVNSALNNNNKSKTKGGKELEVPVPVTEKVPLSVTVPVSASVTERMSVADKYHFLVVDDSVLNRKMVCKLLRAANHTCSEAVDGIEAIRKTMSSSVKIDNVINSLGNSLSDSSRNQNYDAILMDFMMPNMDGPSATQALRDLGYKGLILGVTGNVLPSDIAHFIAHGADQVLLKPLDIQLLHVAVAEFQLKNL